MTEENKQLFDILKKAIWDKGTCPEITPSILKELKAQTVDGLVSMLYSAMGNSLYRQITHYVWMVKAQEEVVKLFQESAIPMVIIKGTASGIYYPHPQLRIYGDIDLLVKPEQYKVSVELMTRAGYTQHGDIGHYHTAFIKGGHIFELHQSPPDLEDVKEGKYILYYLLSGFEDIQEGRTEQPDTIFPMLPWRQNGLELIWHVREHLYNGLGLRQIIDWMMFAHHHLRDDETFEAYKEVLEKAGLLQLAKTITRMCQIYLGLPDKITWCADVDGVLCEHLMNFILEQGNFGHKRSDDKVSKVMTRYRTPAAFLKGMQKKGLDDWKAAKRYSFLRPFAWIHTGIVGIRHYRGKTGRELLAKDRALNLSRQEMFDQLYDKKAKGSNSDVSMNRTVQSADRIRRFKQRIMPFYSKIRKSFFRMPLYYLQEFYFLCKYYLFLKPRISQEDRDNVAKNVTFIYKSFNRQKKATRLYHCIKAYYPKAKVIIADDSKKPLEIEDLSQDDRIIYLPFNSGISRGLIAALDKVKTSYVMRMDDDELIIPQSTIHEQLKFLQKHDEVDLLGIQMTNRWPEKRAVYYSRLRMPKKLLIPAGTMVEGKEVVYKAPNVFLAKTEALRQVGYDPQIRMIEHNEFFYRAAGKIVCVQDPHAFVMHCHNHFEKDEYQKYRADTRGDATYIYRKHGKDYR